MIVLIGMKEGNDMRQGTFQWMKSVNKSIILNKIRTDSPISRAEIAKQTKLTPPTVSNNVKELIEQGIVKESELGESQGGRKPTMLLINSDAFYIIGVDVGPKTVECIVVNLSGEIIERSTNTLTLPLTNDAFLAIIVKNIHHVIKQASIPTEKMIGIGVAMHGVVEIKTGTSLFAPNLRLQNIPIKATLEKEFDLQVKVENDARAMALGEAWFGDYGEQLNMVAMNIGRGVGAGIVMGGKLYHGAQDIAGEIGHMTIDVNGKVCECGNRGCLQTFITGSAIAARALPLLPDFERNGQVLSGEKVYELAREGNVVSRQILVETGEMIGIGLINLIHILNPDKIILGGGVTGSEEFIFPAIQETIEKRALTPQARKTEVLISELGKDATIIGAVSLLLVDLFAPV